MLRLIVALAGGMWHQQQPTVRKVNSCGRDRRCADACMMTIQAGLSQHYSNSITCFACRPRITFLAGAEQTSKAGRPNIMSCSQVNTSGVRSKLPFYVATCLMTPKGHPKHNVNSFQLISTPLD
jgi:hypothetical protein